ncbi:MAG: hypothetical protein ACRDRZ_04965 [Pseudonocardiaceae bacterium]
MPVVSDFIQIIGDAPVTIGDANVVFEASFNTGGREAGTSVGQTAFLIFNVRGLTHANQDVVVRVNGTEQGTIQHYFPGGPGVNEGDIDDPAKLRHQNHWYTQLIALTGSQLNDGDNELQIEAVRFPGNTAGNTFDDFQIKDMICFFHQNA